METENTHNNNETILNIDYFSEKRSRRGRMVVGLTTTTTCAISAYQLESRSWRDVPDTTIYDKVTCDRSVAFIWALRFPPQ